MERSKFPKDLELELGMKFQTQGPAGKVLSVIVKDIKDDKVLVDGNHPLAGLSLKFALNVLRVRKATDQELAKQEVDPTLIH
jgi:FKBP-type peptidyl-prolyl cis-trans isomerase SlyD